MFQPRRDGIDEDVPWDGTRKVHPNDDRRPPVLWTRDGVGLTLIDPNEPTWYTSRDGLTLENCQTAFYTQ